MGGAPARNVHGSQGIHPTQNSVAEAEAKRVIEEASSKGRRKDGRVYKGVEWQDSGGTDGHSLH